MKSKSKLKNKNLVYKCVIGSILCVYSLLLLAIIYWCLSTAFKTQEDFMYNLLGLPKKVQFNNVAVVFQNFKIPVTLNGNSARVNLIRILFNTAVYAFGGAFVATLVPCIVAYVTSRFDYKFCKLLYSTVIVTMALPIVGSLPASLAVMKTLNLYDNLFGCLIQKSHFLTMYYLIFFATFKGVAKEYVEAAYIDGASELTIMVRIMLPLVRTTFLTIMLIYFIDLWNDYQAPLIYMPNHPTIAYAVYYISRSTVTGLSTTPMRMMTCLFMVVPTLTLFLIFKNKMMGNLSMGGVKG